MRPPPYPRDLGLALDLDHRFPLDVSAMLDSESYHMSFREMSTMIEI